ncbi:hypothetical protein O181_037702 [Austropuccinia psidii MF-1]|uniref:Uncharacterized protein n=1 Tax=Austropuccinia psidii MF-1 TaxID=1389203 RepID=A0A9Q3DDA3_9BASI|nr:hypothetical protein [Austropuccinia psidii MF-1]
MCYSSGRLEQQSSLLLPQWPGSVIGFDGELDVLKAVIGYEEDSHDFYDEKPPNDPALLLSNSLSSSDGFIKHRRCFCKGHSRMIPARLRSSRCSGSCLVSSDPSDNWRCPTGSSLL